MCVCVCVFGRSRKPSFVTCGLSTLTRASIKSSQLWHVVEMDGRAEWCSLLENEDIHQVLRNCSDGQYFTNLECDGTVTVLPGSGNGNTCSLYPGHVGAQTQGYNGGFIS